MQHTDFLNPLLSGFLPNCFSALLAKTHEADLREYHKKTKNTFEKTKKQQKTKECMLIQIYIYTLKVKENIYTLYSNTNRNTMMEKTTLQLIRKVEEKNKKPANKIESKPG